MLAPIIANGGANEAKHSDLLRGDAQVSEKRTSGWGRGHLFENSKRRWKNLFILLPLVREEAPLPSGGGVDEQMYGDLPAYHSRLWPVGLDVLQPSPPGRDVGEALDETPDLLPLSQPIQGVEGREHVSSLPEEALDALPVRTPDSVERPLPVLWEGIEVAVTFFNCTGQGGGYCGRMANGEVVYRGAAACGSALRLGTTFTLRGDPVRYTCADRGLGGPYWVDIWFESYEEGRDWIAQVGTRGVIWVTVQGPVWE